MSIESLAPPRAPVRGGGRLPAEAQISTGGADLAPNDGIELPAG